MARRHYTKLHARIPVEFPHRPPLESIKMITPALPRLALLLTFAVTATGLAGCAPKWMARADDGPHGTINVATLSPPIDMHRVVLQAIDGKAASSGGSVRVPPNASLMIVKSGFQLTDVRSQFMLPPGEHELEFTAVVDERDAQMFLSSSSPYSDKGTGKLRIVVQEGQRYYIAAKVNPGKPDEWEPVVYKTEEIRNYDPKG
jgi:hypothetical protein